jgi:hypothetical protein
MDTQLLPYRLKSARRKKRLQIEDRDKQILALDRERDRIRNDPGYKTVVQLDEPYQKGWKRLFVLKPKAQRGDKAALYQGILDKINTVQYHYDASFKNSKRIRRWHRYYHEGPPKLQHIKQRYWQTGEYKLTEEQCACFQLVQYWDEAYYRLDYCYEFSFPEVFKIAVLPHIIDTVKIGDALLEQRMAWIDNQFYKNGLQYRLQKLHKGGYSNGWKIGREKLKYVNPLKNVPVYLAEDHA